MYWVVCVLLTEVFGATLTSAIPFQSRVMSIRSSGLGENKPILSPNPFPEKPGGSEVVQPPHTTHFGPGGQPIDPNASFNSNSNVILPGVPAGPDGLPLGNAEKPGGPGYSPFPGPQGGQGMPTDPNASINSRPQSGPDSSGGSSYPPYPGPPPHGMPTDPNASINSRPQDSPVFPQSSYPSYPGSPIGHGMPSDPNPLRPAKWRRGVGFQGQPTDPNASRHSLPPGSPDSPGGLPFPAYPGPQGTHGMPTDPNASANSRPQEGPLFPPGPVYHGYAVSPGDHGMPTDPNASKHQMW